MIGNTIKELLTSRKMTAGELAKRIGVPVQTLYSIIRRDNMKIDFDVLLRICEVLEVPVESFCGPERTASGPTPEEYALLGKLRELDSYGRETIGFLVDRELARVTRERGSRETPRGRIIPLYRTPAAAGYASPALDEDYEDYAVSGDCEADFAVRIDGDSMEPVLHDGGIALVKREAISNGDVGMFFVDGDMKCKQYVRDNFGNVYLLSLNRARADADVTIPASSGLTLCCFGKVLLDRRPAIPI
ncbi:MAG: LexA family transcriptional regulator [Oscillospiraceae bacterium]|nr:LexA family transcriptional regulator [Oscillospiraceae bacterium]